MMPDSVEAKGTGLASLASASSPSLFQRIRKAACELEGVLLITERRIIHEVVLCTKREAKILVHRKEQPRDDLRTESGGLTSRRIECRQDCAGFIEDQPLGKLLHKHLADAGADQIQRLSGWEVRRRIEVLFLIVNVALYVESPRLLFDDRVASSTAINLLYLQTGSDIVICTGVAKHIKALRQILVTLDITMQNVRLRAGCSLTARDKWLRRQPIRRRCIEDCLVSRRQPID